MTKVPGFNSPYALEHNYTSILSKLREGFSQTDTPCLLYGSVSRGTHNSGISDIDALVILPCDVESNKEMLRRLSYSFSNAMRGNESVPVQFSITDRGSMFDGRFSTFGPSFLKHFIGEGQTLGINPFLHIHLAEYEEYKHEFHSRIGFNLAKIRKGLFEWDFKARTSPEELRHRAKSSIDQILRSTSEFWNYFHRNTLEYQSPRGSKKTLEWIARNINGVDVDFLDSLKSEVSNKNTLANLYQDEDKLREKVEKGLTQMEREIKWFIDLPQRERNIKVKEAYII